MTHLQSVDQLLLDGVLSGGVGRHAQPLGGLPQPLLLVLVLGVRRCALNTQTRCRSGQSQYRRVKDFASHTFFVLLKDSVIPGRRVITSHSAHSASSSYNKLLLLNVNK